MIIRANATSYTNSVMGLLDGTGSFAPAFEPAAAVPEPGTIGLLASGLLALVGVVR